MVMAGEDVANDVDDEVYVCDGVEGKRQLETGEESPLRIKQDSLIFLVKREQQEHCAPLYRPQTLQGWCTTQRTFHSGIGAHSALQVVDEFLRTEELW